MVLFRIIIFVSLTFSVCGVLVSQEPEQEPELAPLECDPLRGKKGTEAEGSMVKRFRCMDEDTGLQGSAFDLAELAGLHLGRKRRVDLDDADKEAYKTRIKTILAPPDRHVGFVWTGYIFSSNSWHNSALSWELHSSTPKHTEYALEDGLAAFDAYTIDMTKFGKHGMELIPYDFCIDKNWKDICEEGKLYHAMWTVASELYAERILEGGVFGVLANARHKQHVMQGIMAENEIPNIIKALNDHGPPEGKELKTVVFNLMDHPGTEGIKCAELEDKTALVQYAKVKPDGSRILDYNPFARLKATVVGFKGEDAWKCHDCAGSMNAEYNHDDRDQKTNFVRAVWREFGYHGLYRCILASGFLGFPDEARRAEAMEHVEMHEMEDYSDKQKEDWAEVEEREKTEIWEPIRQEREKKERESNAFTTWS